MPESSGILVDTSVWVRFFRSAQNREAVHLDGLLQAQGVKTCAPIRAEVLSGARTERERIRLRELFRAVPCLDLPGDIWELIEEARFTLARKGIQATLIDLMIASVSEQGAAPLWTLDEDFSHIQNAIPFSRYIPEI